MTTKYQTREQWLQAATTALRELFSARSYTVPAIRVSCGWPSKSALSAKSRRIGECWSPEASSDGTGEVFISPYLSDAASECGVLATLVHGLVHAAVGVEEGHKGPFKKCAKALGLEGKMTATHAGEELVESLKAIAEELGEYPHATLDLAKSPRKKPSTRMIKCVCGVCGFTVRTTRKWLDEVGVPHCPRDGEMNAELPADDSGDPDDDGE
jgi:hypothetical protein